MFDRYMAGQTEKPRKWVGITVTVSVVMHIFAGIGLVAYSFWKIEKLQTKGTQLSFFAVATPPPPPPPAAAPPPPPSTKKIVAVVKHHTQEIVQPPKDPPKEQPKEQQAADPGFTDPNGDPNADPNATDPNGDPSGDQASDQPPPKEEPKVEAPQQIAQQMVSGQMIAGNEQIHMSPSVNSQASGQGLDKVKMKAKICFNAAGEPTSVQVTKSSGFPDLDNDVQEKMREWRYRPYMVNGKAVPFCFPVNFKWEISKD